MAMRFLVEENAAEEERIEEVGQRRLPVERRIGETVYQQSDPD